MKTYDNNVLGFEIAILDKDGVEAAKILYKPSDPLSCGARCWIETKNEVVVYDK